MVQEFGGSGSDCFTGRQQGWSTSAGHKSQAPLHPSSRSHPARHSDENQDRAGLAAGDMKYRGQLLVSPRKCSHFLHSTPLHSCCLLVSVVNAVVLGEAAGDNCRGWG